MNKLTLGQAHYIAAVLDGEGYIGRRISRGDRVSPVVTIANTAREWLETIRADAGCGVFHAVSRLSEKHKQAYALAFRKEEIRHLLPQVLPYLRLKKRQAELVLELCILPRGDSKKFRVAAQLSALNKKGSGTPLEPQVVLSERTCPECGVVFQPLRNTQAWCSMRCYQRYYQRELKRRRGAKWRYPDHRGYKR